MNIENTTDFSAYLNSIHDDDIQEESFYMNKVDYDFCKREFIREHGQYICDRDVMFLIWRIDLEGADLDEFFDVNIATIMIDKQVYTAKEMRELHKKYKA